MQTWSKKKSGSLSTSRDPLFEKSSTGKICDFSSKNAVFLKSCSENAISSVFSQHVSSDSSPNPFRFNCRDPGRRPICDKISSFEQNYSKLPETRLKLLVNPKILTMDQAALNHISLKLAEEQCKETEKQNFFIDFRKRAITATEVCKKKTEILQAKTGLLKFTPVHSVSNLKTTSRIEALSRPKVLKKGLAEDYMESYGLLRAGLLETGNSAVPKSARVPISKTFRAKPLGTAKTYRKKIGQRQEIEENFIYSGKEIEECMKEIQKFHKIFGELKGRVGFPKIHLTKDGPKK